MGTNKVISRKIILIGFPFIISCFSFRHAMAQNLLQHVDKILTDNYSKGDIDTSYIARPNTKWTIVGRVNVTGAKIEAEGEENTPRVKGMRNYANRVIQISKEKINMRKG